MCNLFTLFIATTVPLHHWFTLFPSNSLNLHNFSIRAQIISSFTFGLSGCIFSYLSVCPPIYIVLLSSSDVILKSSFFASNSLSNTSKSFDFFHNCVRLSLGAKFTLGSGGISFLPSTDRTLSMN